MRRREFIALGAASALCGTGGAPAAWAQQPAGRKRVGLLYGSASSDGSLTATQRAYIDAIRAGLQDEGFTDGTNVTLDVRGGADDTAATRAAARDLAGGGYDVLISTNTPTTAALLAETKTIPIVFSGVSDPVGSGFVQTFALPGGNVTGFTNVAAAMGGRWLGMLCGVAPGVRRAVLMLNPDGGEGADFFLPTFRDDARILKIEPVVAEVRTPREIEAAIEAMGKAAGSGLVVPANGYMLANRRAVIDVMARHNLPAIYGFPEFADEGGLLGYGSDTLNLFRRSGGYAGLILKGVRTSDLPVQAPTKFALSVNLKTAKAQGITIPSTLVVLADKVIE